MLIEFKVANYRSIRTEQTLSMVASNYSDELPQNLVSCDHVPGLKGTKLVKAVALYGANASGKSNVVGALRFFAEFVRDSATKLQPGAPTGTQPFKLAPECITQPSKFEITAVINGVRTLYGIEMTRERVTSEWLVAYPKGRPQMWFEREWDERKEKYKWSKSAVHFKHDAALREKTRENAAFVSVAAQFSHEQSKSLHSWIGETFMMLDVNSQVVAAVATRTMLNFEQGRSILVNAIKIADVGIVNARSRKPAAKEAMRDFLNWLRMRNEEGECEDLYKAFAEAPPPENLTDGLDDAPMPEFLHASIGKDGVALDFYKEESLGTQRYTALIGEFILGRLGRVVITDELEASLHPILVRHLIDQFFLRTPSQDAHGQLIFTTHNPLLLDQTLLRRDQIWFTEKDREGATRLYPLTDFKPRKDESLVKGYLAGRYGGIPFIPEGLRF